MLIVIEGQDATGKDTQAKLLVEYLRSQGKKVTHYAESGTASEDPFISTIAKLNYGTDQGIDHRTRVLLFLINRYEQWRRFAEPALKNNEIVITTRSWLSTLIYEGYGGGVSKSLIAKVHHTVMPERYFHPDKIVILTLDDKARAARISEDQAHRGGEVFKSQPDAFQKKLNDAYLKVAKDYNIPTLSAAGSIAEVHENLKSLFQI